MSLLALLDSAGLSKYADKIIDVSGAETVEDLQGLDAASTEEVIKAAGLPVLFANKFRKLCAEHSGEDAQARSTGGYPAPAAAPVSMPTPSYQAPPSVPSTAEPVQAFPVGAQILLNDGAVMRAGESTDSAEVAEMAPGQQCLVLAHGVGPSGRRLLIRDLTTRQEGWISCVAKSGRRLIVLVDGIEPASEGARHVAADASGSNSRAVEAPTYAAHPPTAQQVGPPSLNAGFPLGTQVTLLTPHALTSEEDAGSRPVATLTQGQRCEVFGAGTAPGSVRLQVRTIDGSGQQQGWLSCATASGEYLIALAPPMMAAEPEQPMENMCDKCGNTGVETFGQACNCSIAKANICPICQNKGVDIEGKLCSAEHGCYIICKVCSNSGVDMGGNPCSCPYKAAARAVAEVPSSGYQPTSVDPSSPFAQFPVGSQIRTLSETNMRSGEDLQSPTLLELTADQMCTILQHGVGPTGRRIYVRTLTTQKDGWISCMSSSRLPLIAVVSMPQMAEAAAVEPSSQIPTSQAPDFPTSQAAANETPGHKLGFVLGDWEYICVAREGIPLRSEANDAKSPNSGAELSFGEVVKICERGRSGGMVWVQLADGRGWAYERDKSRTMSEVTYEDITDEKQVCVHPRLNKAYSLQQTPFADDRGGQPIHAGVPVRISQRAKTTVPLAKDKAKEGHKIFLKISDGKDIEGWIPEYGESGNKMIEEYTSVQGLGKPGCNAWLTVLSDKGTNVYSGPGLSNKKLKSFDGGELMECMERFNAGDHVFYRLTDDGWVFGGANGKSLVDLATREPHWFIYVCNDKEGANVRNTPTRCTNQGKDKRLKHRQRVKVSEKCCFAEDGDMFLKLESPHSGWVPMCKKGGGSVKMVAVMPIPAQGGNPMMGGPPMGGMGMGNPAMGGMGGKGGGPPIGTPNGFRGGPPMGGMGGKGGPPMGGMGGPPMGGMGGPPMSMGGVGGPMGGKGQGLGMGGPPMGGGGPPMGGPPMGGMMGGPPMGGFSMGGKGGGDFGMGPGGGGNMGPPQSGMGPPQMGFGGPPGGGPPGGGMGFGGPPGGGAFGGGGPPSMGFGGGPPQMGPSQTGMGGGGGFGMGAPGGGPPQQMGGFGGQPQQQMGFGGPPQQQMGFSGPPQQGKGFGGPPQGGFGI